MTTDDGSERPTSSSRISRSMPRARVSARLSAARPVATPEPRKVPAAWLAWGAGLLLLTAGLLLWERERAVPRPGPPPRIQAAVARDPDSPRRVRGRVQSIADDTRGFRLATGAGPIDVRFANALAADLVPGGLVEVEGRVEGLEGAAPRRMKAKLLKVLSARQ